MSRENVAFAIATFIGVVLLFTIGLSRPDLFVEDGLVENLSAVGFAAATLFALSAALQGRVSLTSAERRILVGTSALSLVLFLSEISFGARIFGIQMPQMSGGGEFDGGHDIVILVVRQLRDAGPTGILAAVIAGGLLLAIVFAVLRRFRQRAQMLAAHVLSKPFVFRLAMALGLLASAVTLDVIPSYKASILEEVLEFSVSVVLILAVSALFRSKSVVAVQRGCRHVRGNFLPHPCQSDGE
ncbi:hypothetical protein ACG873_21965 [Mesorhizobium sp. AaZ16]|uniref:hypothetical protein n=1 Tax=Mesorhizobium sp. AaZ16 TaxID=3402289 RepID=UPI00374FC1B2